MNHFKMPYMGSYGQVSNNLMSMMLFLLALLSLPLSASATIINPAPGTYGPDDGSIAFSPDTDAYFFEAFDSLSSLGVPTRFGFYKTADPSTLVTLFDSADQGPPDQLAWVNFPSGGVVDLDTFTLQGTFIPGQESIGFFLELNLGSLLTIYSDPALNAGFDLMASFPDLVNPGVYMLGVEVPDGIGGMVTIYLATASGINHNPIPEPSTLLLLSIGFISFWGWGKYRKQA